MTIDRQSRQITKVLGTVKCHGQEHKAMGEVSMMMGRFCLHCPVEAMGHVWLLIALKLWLVQLKNWICNLFDFKWVHFNFKYGYRWLVATIMGHAGRYMEAKRAMVDTEACGQGLHPKLALLHLSTTQFHGVPIWKGRRKDCESIYGVNMWNVSWVNLWNASRHGNESFQWLEKKLYVGSYRYYFYKEAVRSVLTN